MRKLTKEALWALAAATWIAGLVHQFRSWPMATIYVAISLAMVAVTFGDRRALKFARRKNRRR